MDKTYLNDLAANGVANAMVERQGEPNWIDGAEVEIVNKFAGQEYRCVLAKGDIIYDRYYKRHYICEGFYLNGDVPMVQFIVGQRTSNKYAVPVDCGRFAMKVAAFQNSCDGGAYGRRGYFEWMRKN